MSNAISREAARTLLKLGMPDERDTSKLLLVGLDRNVQKPVYGRPKDDPKLYHTLIKKEIPEFTLEQAEKALAMTYEKTRIKDARTIEEKLAGSGITLETLKSTPLFMDYSGLRCYTNDPGEDVWQETFHLDLKAIERIAGTTWEQAHRIQPRQQTQR